VKEVADYLLSITDIRPKIGIICGSGLGDLVNQVENAEEFEYSKIPKFPVSTGELDTTQLCLEWDNQFHSATLARGNILIVRHKIFELLKVGF